MSMTSVIPCRSVSIDALTPRKNVCAALTPQRASSRRVAGVALRWTRKADCAPAASGPPSCQ